LQLALFGPELEDVVLPSEDDELDELLLSACAAAATAMARAAAQHAVGFIAQIPCADISGTPRCRPVRRCIRGVRHASVVIAIAIAALMLASVFAALFTVLAGALVGIIESGLARGRAAGADGRSGRALASRRAAGAQR